MISGNHDTPRLPGTGSPYSALSDTFPEMHFAHRLAYDPDPGLAASGHVVLFTKDGVGGTVMQNAPGARD